MSSSRQEHIASHLRRRASFAKEAYHSHFPSEATKTEDRDTDDRLSQAIFNSYQNRELEFQAFWSDASKKPTRKALVDTNGEYIDGAGVVEAKWSKRSTQRALWRVLEHSIGEWSKKEENWMKKQLNDMIQAARLKDAEEQDRASELEREQTSEANPSDTTPPPKTYSYDSEDRGPFQPKPSGDEQPPQMSALKKTTVSYGNEQREPVQTTQSDTDTQADFSRLHKVRW